MQKINPNQCAKIALCFAILLFLWCIVITIIKSSKPEPQVIYVTDEVTEKPVVTIETVYETEVETDTEERRFLYTGNLDPSIVLRFGQTDRLTMIVFEYSEDEDVELAAPEVEPFEFFSSYVDLHGKVTKLRLSEQTQEIVYDKAKQYDLPHRVVLAVLGVETDWNENASHRETHDGTRYIGIGCICEKYHAKKLAEKGIDIYTLDGNIEGVCYLLNEWRQQLGSLTYAVMAYNGGGGYARSNREKGIAETSYTKWVKSIADSLQ